VTEFSSFAANTALEATPLSIPLSKQNGLIIQRETSVTKHYLTDQTNPDAALMRLYPNQPQRMVVTFTPKAGTATPPTTSIKPISR
jgi:hypothetical protein